MPPGFSFPNKQVDIWTPIAFTSEQLAARDSHYLEVVGRLRPGVGIAEANAQLLVLANGWPNNIQRVA